MVKVLTGGPLSEITRSVYKQVRLLSTTNPDILEKVHDIFSEDNGFSYTPSANAITIGYGSISNHLEDNKLALISIVKSDYEILRRASNRCFFMESNPLLFDSSTLKSTRAEFESAKRKLSYDKESTTLAMVMRKVEHFLINDRHVSFHTIVLIHQEVCTTGLQVFYSLVWVLAVAKRSNHYDSSE